MTREQQLQQAYKQINSRLFNNSLPPAVVYIDSDRYEYAGYYQHKALEQTGKATDLIIINDDYFKDNRSVLTCLLHEMVHQWDCHENGAPLIDHHRKWLDKMREIGIVAKEAGNRMDDIILPNSQFDKLADQLIADGFNVL